jgi:hypothetical protein
VTDLPVHVGTLLGFCLCILWFDGVCVTLWLEGSEGFISPLFLEATTLDVGVTNASDMKENTQVSKDIPSDRACVGSFLVKKSAPASLQAIEDFMPSSRGCPKPMGIIVLLESLRIRMCRQRASELLAFVFMGCLSIVLAGQSLRGMKASEATRSKFLVREGCSGNVVLTDQGSRIKQKRVLLNSALDLPDWELTKKLKLQLCGVELSPPC